MTFYIDFRFFFGILVNGASGDRGGAAGRASGVPPAVARRACGIPATVAGSVAPRRLR